MLPLKSNTTVLAIAPDGLALRLPNRRAIQLNQPAEDKPSTPLDNDALANTLRTHADDLKQQKVRVIVSNHYMRYLVLPWETGVTARSDWLALAEQAFRQQYGAAVNDWAIRVSLNQHGAPVIASAMDQSLMTTIEALASDLQFKLYAIEPLLMAIAPKHSTDDSLLMVEPGRLLLCEMEHAHISQFTAVSPPAAQEANSAKQLITRYHLQHNQPDTSIVTYVSAPLNTHWAQAEINHLQQTTRVVYLNKQAPSHACWLAEL